MADPALEALLEVQAHDVVLDQLRYRRQSLPERAQLRDRRYGLTRLEAALVDGEARSHQLARSQRRLEDEIESVEAHAASSEGQLYSGNIHAPKELQARSAEVEALRRRKRQLEDELLEVMEAAEPVTAEIGDLEQGRRGAQADIERLGLAIATQEADIDDQMGAVVAERAEAGAKVGPELLGTYERLRSRLGGIGVARIEAGRCTGCHLSLPAVELDALRRAGDGAVVRHEECGRILVT
ncbi:MAG: zinc ribbon domain-containing protein [Acidimicrobiales bacterium]